ncbi:GMP synthase [glutamine-hydrolyzing] [Colletotrichum tanaceti]|nr:GMP synthase [glutamine-hydrolyzing] [Colletotrichum tanaceti]
MAESPVVTPSIEGLRQHLSCLIPDFLKCINYAQPPKPNHEALREALIERGRQAGVYVEPGDGSNMRFEAGLAVAADMYPLHTFDIQVHIGLFTWLGFIIDDLNAELGSDLDNFQSRFFRGDTQPCAVLQCFAGVLRSTTDYYDPVVANLIVLSALAFVNSNAIELRREYHTIALTREALSWPYYFRDKEGLPEVYTYFCFYKEVCPDISRFMPAAPEMEKFINLTNDILSFYKEEKAGEKEIVRIRHLVGDHAQVIGAVSGGVDSTVAAKLMKEAIGDRFHAILVDNGVMRLNACQQGVTEPEKKRKIIGGTFIDLFEKEAIRIEKDAENTPNAGKVEWFLQGTLYPDVIESLSSKGPSATIKTYHNVGGLPDTLKLKLIEPLRELFKDEVRSFDREFGIHSDLIMRHPFPGPGIAIRILGEVTPERVAIARAADNIFISMIKEAGIYDQMPQSYAGRRQGDARVYGYIVILRAVQTADFMSCEPFEFDFNLLKISTRIVNEVEGVSRVVYDITSKPPGTIELE